MSLSCAIFNRLKFCAHLTASSFFPKLSTFNFLYSCLTRQNFSDGGSIFNLLAILLLVTSVSNASCTLQLHAYDYQGQGWAESTVTITNGKDVLLENWSMSEGYFEQVEFEFHGERLNLEFDLFGGELSGYADFTICNESGNILFYKHDPYYSYYERSDEITWEFTCDEVHNTIIRQWSYAKPDLEPECDDGYVDEFNGGCNSQAHEFTDLICGETILGTVSQFMMDQEMVYDEDWYQISINGGALGELNFFTEMPLVMELIKHENCEEIEVIRTESRTIFDDQFSLGWLTEGDYSVRIVPMENYAVSCGSDLQYAISLDCSGGITEQSCTVEEEHTCFSDFEDALNDICETGNDRVSFFKMGCINEGRTGTYVKDGAVTVDYDYFSFPIWEEQDIPVVIESTFPLMMTLFQGGCGDHVFVDSLNIEPHIATTFQTGTLVPDDYLIMFEPAEGSGTSCGADYKFLFESGHYGNSLNNADLMSVNGFYNSDRSSISEGDTNFAEDRYSIDDYGCGTVLDSPETVHRISVPEGVTVSVVIEADGWEPQLVFTREWPPLECRMGEKDPEDTSIARFDRLILNSDTNYFFFVENVTERGGPYELRLVRLDPATDMMNVELELNQDQFAAGDAIKLLGRYRNDTASNQHAYLGMTLEIQGEFWMINGRNEWSTPTDYYFRDYLDVGEEVERYFVDAIWPDTPFLNMEGVFTFFLFDFDDEENPFLQSNIETEEFLF